VVASLAVVVGVVVAASAVVMLASGGGGGSGQAAAAAAGGGSPSHPVRVVELARPAPPRIVRISIRRFLFHAPSVTVARGTRVRWTNEDGTEHSATEEGRFDTGILPKGHARTLTFRRPGTYRYICVLHPFMRGRLVVR
jgi:plastocyanin